MAINVSMEDGYLGKFLTVASATISVFIVKHLAKQ
jgi:hypothetical protein